MSPLPWPLIATETLLATKVFGLHKERSRSPRTGREHDFFVLTGNDWCNIIPITEGGEVVMIRQFRHGIRGETLEIPGGLIDERDPSPLHAARREMLEETGYDAPTVEPIGVIHPNPALQRHRCFSFVARSARRVAEPRLDQAEDIEVVLVPLKERPAILARGEITHALVVVAFAWLLGLAQPAEEPRPQP